MIFSIVLIFFCSLISIFVYNLYGGQVAFNRYLLVVLLTIPFSYCFIITPVITPITFYIAVIFPIFLLAYTKEIRRFNFNLIDFLIIFFMLVACISSVIDVDLKSGLNALSHKVVHAGIPYFLVRILFDRSNILNSLIILSILITCTAAFAPLEYFFDIKVADILQRIWPVWVVLSDFKRGGFFRVFSIYGHPIHASIVFSVAFFIGFMCFRMPTFKQKTVPILIMVINTIAIYMTVSRSSLALLVPIIILINFCFSKRKILYSIFWGALLVTVLCIALPIWNKYTTSVNSNDETQTSAAYRAVLVNNYLGKIQQKPLFGWAYIPVVGMQSSIDNYYLYLALMYGLPMAIIFILILLLQFIKGLIYFKTTNRERDKTVLWVLMAILVYYANMASIVWLSAQALILLFVILGYVSILIDGSPRKLKKVPVFMRYI